MNFRFVESTLIFISLISQSRADLAAQYESEILPIFENYCYDCHGDGVKKGELALDDFKDIDSMVKNRETWKRIRDHIDFRLMPPPDEVSPESAERKNMIDWIDAAVFPVDPQNQDPGHVTLRRLNRNEYQNTLRDLLGVSVDVATLLPEDDSGYGFDNIADVLTLSPQHLERYLEAARLGLGIATHPGPMPPEKVNISGKDLKGGGYISNTGHLLFANGEAFAEIPITTSGKYRVAVTVSGTPAADVWPNFELKGNGETLASWKTENPQHRPETLHYELNIEDTTPIRIVVNFTNDAWLPDHKDEKQRDRNLCVHQISLEGPLDGPAKQKPESHRNIYVERQAAETDKVYMSRVLKQFAHKAFRRPASDEEISRYLTFIEIAKSDGGDIEQAIQMALETILVSPLFLFREEPTTGEPNSEKKLISEHALASRLSYFLWSTMPDKTLLSLADAGKLREQLNEQIQRMLKSKKADAFVSNFTGQWLQLRDMASLSPSKEQFPQFNHGLFLDMKTETESLFRHVIENDLSVHTLLEADFSFINERLAQHYGITNVVGKEFRKVSLIGTQRRGILNHGSILSLTSYPTRTSPVIRGKFVLENILDTPPPPPPPNIPQLKSPESHGKKLSLRAQMELHRDDPNCASCHALMDPIGFGLENFDALGTWREKENDLLIDPKGKLATGQKFNTAEELRHIISKDNQTQFQRALTTKLLIYALGRGTDWYDRPAIDEIVKKASSNDGRFHSLIRAIVESVPFQYRRSSL